MARWENLYHVHLTMSVLKKEEGARRVTQQLRVLAALHQNTASTKDSSQPRFQLQGIQRPLPAVVDTALTCTHAHILIIYT